MFFTQEDYRKIEKWLESRSVKDSEFPIANSLDRFDYIPIVQDKSNRILTIYDFVKRIPDIEVPDYYNLTNALNNPRLSLTEAIASIPEDRRKVGLTITFRNKEHNWVAYQFIGNSWDKWTDPAYWVSPIQVELDTKVDKIAGKGLSTVDFTYGYEQRLLNAPRIFEDGMYLPNLGVKPKIGDLNYLSNTLWYWGEGLEVGKNTWIPLATLDNLESLYDNTIKPELNKKVDRITGKGLSSNDYIDEDKTKVDNLSSVITNQIYLERYPTRLHLVHPFKNLSTGKITNYSTVIEGASAEEAGVMTAADKVKLDTLETNFNTLVKANPTSAIESFNEIVNFLEGVKDTATLAGIVAGIGSQIDKKVDKETGKGLSTHDFNINYKNKLDKAPIFIDGSLSGLSSIPASLGDFGYFSGYLWFNEGNETEAEWTALATVDSVTESLQTLDEEIEEKLDNKVDKEESKGLSSNDFTNKYKNILDNNPRIYKEDLPPFSTANPGDLWYCSNLGLYCFYDGEEWVPITNAYILKDALKDKIDSNDLSEALSEFKINSLSKQAVHLEVKEHARKCFDLVLNNLPDHISINAIIALNEKLAIYRTHAVLKLIIFNVVGADYNSDTDKWVIKGKSIAVENSKNSFGFIYDQNTGNITLESYSLTSEDVDLGNVDNTSDLDKPISNATQEALDNKVDKVEGKGLSANDFNNTYKTKLDNLGNVIQNIGFASNSNKVTLYYYFRSVSSNYTSIIPEGINLPLATSTLAGIMTASDKKKLDNIDYFLTGADIDRLTTTNELYIKIYTKTSLNNNTTQSNLIIPNATQELPGTMSSEDKVKLDSISTETLDIINNPWGTTI